MHQFEALIPPVIDEHPQGCHWPSVANRVVFDKLVQVLLLGTAYEKIADSTAQRPRSGRARRSTGTRWHRWRPRSPATCPLSKRTASRPRSQNRSGSRRRYGCSAPRNLDRRRYHHFDTRPLSERSRGLDRVQCGLSAERCNKLTPLRTHRVRVPQSVAAVRSPPPQSRLRS